MSNQVVILHGWSDTSESFKGLSSHLKESGFQTVPILLGDYISLRDDVTIEDVAKRMEEVISDRLALPASSPSRLGPKFHLVVHSTGGLVARRWISRYYMDRPCPVKNMLMLAPANFGSKLAHKGRSLLGRVVKGWRTGFETGEEMLYALELNSPFLWDLAEADLFQAPDAPDGAALYSPDKVRPFVIVGTHPYDGLGDSADQRERLGRDCARGGRKPQCGGRYRGLHGGPRSVGGAAFHSLGEARRRRCWGVSPGRATGPGSW